MSSYYFNFILNLTHPQVPVCARGLGLGALLARAALDWAVREGRRVTLSCSYLQKYHRENRDMGHLRVVAEEQQGT